MNALRALAQRWAATPPATSLAVSQLGRAGPLAKAIAPAPWRADLPFFAARAHHATQATVRMAALRGATAPAPLPAWRAPAALRAFPGSALRPARSPLSRGLCSAAARPLPRARPWVPSPSRPLSSKAARSFRARARSRAGLGGATRALHGRRTLGRAAGRPARAAALRAAGSFRAQVRQLAAGRGGGGGRNLLTFLGGAAVLLAGKTKWLFAMLKLGKFTTLISMLLTSAAYAMFYGWPFALGMVGLIFVHELGHALAMVALGIPVGSMVFIPFVGAAVSMPPSATAFVDALVALGGPLVGSAGALALAMYAHATQSDFYAALADFGLMINLINCLPVGMLDDGRIANALSGWLMLGGFAGGSYLAYMGFFGNPLFYLILLMGGFNVGQRFLPGVFGSTPTPPGFYNITPAQRFIVGVPYAALVSGLIVAMDWNKHNMRRPPPPKAWQDTSLEEWV